MPTNPYWRNAQLPGYASQATVGALCIFHWVPVQLPLEEVVVAV